MRILTSVLVAGLLFEACSAPVTATPSSPAASAGPRSTAGLAVPVSVKVTITPGAVALVGVYAAYYLNFFQKHNLNVELVNVAAGSTAAQVLASGKTEFGYNDSLGAALANDAGADLRIIAAHFQLFPGDLVCRKDVPVSGKYPAVMKQMEGRTVAISAPGSSTDYYLQYSMLQAGADPKTLRMVAAGTVPNYIAAIDAKSVECAVAYQPIQTLLGDKVNSILNWGSGEGPREFQEWSYNAVATTQTYANAHPDVVRAMQAAMADAMDFSRDPKNADAVAKAVQPQFAGVEPNVLLALVRAAQPALAKSPQVSPAQLENARAVYKAVYGKDLPVTSDKVMVSLPPR